MIQLGSKGEKLWFLARPITGYADCFAIHNGSEITVAEADNWLIRQYADPVTTMLSKLEEMLTYSGRAHLKVDDELRFYRYQKGLHKRDLQLFGTRLIGCVRVRDQTKLRDMAYFTISFARAPHEDQTMICCVGGRSYRGIRIVSG